MNHNTFLCELKVYTVWIEIRSVELKYEGHFGYTSQTRIERLEIETLTAVTDKATFHDK